MEDMGNRDEKLASEEEVMGLRFLNLPLDRALAEVRGRRGLVVFPSGSCMERIGRDSRHKEALERADLRLADSGAMVLFWKWITGKSMSRVSGLAFLKAFVSGGKGELGTCFWVMPSARDGDMARDWLASMGIETNPEYFRVAPLYPREGLLEDQSLLETLSRCKPDTVIIALSGGVQEPLGLYLRDHLGYRPLILCVGAALAFLSGAQVGIPGWADRAYLGWLFRCVRHPSRNLPRYFRVFSLYFRMMRSNRRKGKA